MFWMKMVLILLVVCRIMLQLPIMTMMMLGIQSAQSKSTIAYFLKGMLLTCLIFVFQEVECS